MIILYFAKDFASCWKCRTIPESIAIGLSILRGGAVSVATVAVIFMSNLPEGLSSSAGMRRAGRPAAYVFGVWTAIAVAAGGMLAMIVDTMIPEAVAEAHDWARRFVILGFPVLFALTKTNG